MKLKEEKIKGFENYKKSIENTNLLINKRKSYYCSMLESLVLLDQSRSGFAKTLLSKYLILMDKITKNVVEKITNISITLQNIRPELDSYNFATAKENNKGQNVLFTPLKLIEYDSEYFFIIK